MAKQWIYGVFALLTAVAILAWGFRPVEDLRPVERDARLGLRLPDRQGHARSISRENPTLLHFWASWCPPCIDELPAVVEYAKRWEPRGLRVFAVSLDRSWEDADKILGSLKLPDSWVNVLDPEHKSAELFGSFQYPESYWVDRGGKIVKKWVGAQPWESQAMQEATERFVVESSANSGAQ